MDLPLLHLNVFFDPFDLFFNPLIFLDEFIHLAIKFLIFFMGFHIELHLFFDFISGFFAVVFCIF